MNNQQQQQKNILSVREICTKTGKILKEYNYEGYFDITKRRNLQDVGYMVKNGKNIFLNGIHVNEIRKVMKKVTENKDKVSNEAILNDEFQLSDIEKKALKLAPMFTLYNRNISKIKMVDDINALFKLTKNYVTLKNRTNKVKDAENTKEDIDLADRIVELKTELDRKQAAV
jgi:hypothetical protein